MIRKQSESYFVSAHSNVIPVDRVASALLCVWMFWPNQLSCLSSQVHSCSVCGIWTHRQQVRERFKCQLNELLRYFLLVWFWHNSNSKFLLGMDDYRCNCTEVYTELHTMLRVHSLLFSVLPKITEVSSFSLCCCILCMFLGISVSINILRICRPLFRGL